jgi:hypothetical protein
MGALLSLFLLSSFTLPSLPSFWRRLMGAAGVVFRVYCSFSSLLSFFIFTCPVGGYMERSGRYVFGPSPLVLCFPAGVPLFRLCLSAGFRRLLP